ncbi:MAG TPA: glycosyltransferase [Candidatus Paceibacterota bacterium]
MTETNNMGISEQNIKRDGNVGVRIKILFIIGNLDVGGAEKLIINQVKNIDKNKFVPHLCTLFPYGDNNYSEVWKELSDIPYHRFNFKGPYDVFSWIKVWSILRKEKFDIFCCHLFESNFIIRILNLFVGRKPVFIFEHNVYFKKQWWKILADKILAKKTSKIFVDSHAILNFTSDQENIDKDKFAILPYPIELLGDKTFDLAKIKHDLGLPDNAFIIGTVARFVEQKGLPYFIQAAAKILEKTKREDIYFLLVGYGKMELDLRMMVDDLKINSRLLISPPKDIKEILPIFDIFVVPSLWEGQPIAMLEAMASGRSVVATKVGGIPEILIDGKNGLLSEPKDPNSLAKAITKMLEDEKLRVRVGIEAKGTAHNYSMPIYINKLEKYFLDAYNENEN